MTASYSAGGNGPFDFGNDPYVYPQFIGRAMRAPTINDVLTPGTRWQNNSVVPPVIYTTTGAGRWLLGGDNPATNTTLGTVYLATYAELSAGSAASDEYVPSSNDVYTYVNSVAISGAPVATTTTSGIGELATDAEAVAGTVSTGVLALFVTPSNLTPVFASPPALGGTLAAAVTSTDLTADGTGAVSLGSNAAADFTVATGDLSLIATLSSVVITGNEAVADAVQINATTALGGVDINAGTGGLTIDSGGILSLDSAGVTNLTATGAFDVTVSSTAGSMILSAGEDAADAIQILSTAGGMNIAATGEATQDIDITNTGGSVNITATENAALAIYLHANGGASETIRLRSDQGTGANSIDILSDVGGCTVTTGLDAAAALYLHANAGTSETIKIHSDQGTSASSIDILSDVGGVAVTTGLDNANSIYLHANAGTSETIKIHADQGTGAASIELLSDVGGLTLQSGLASADAININASDAAGGIDIDAGTAGVIVDTTGGISLDSAAASNFTATGAFDITVNSTAGSVILDGGEAVADAIQITSSDAAGGIDINAGTGGLTIDSGGILSLDSAGATNLTATGAFDVTVSSTAGSVILDGGEAVADAVQITASDAAGGVDINAGTGGIAADTTAGISLDAATASNLTVTGAADLTLQSTAGAVNVISGEANADSINVTSGGGMSIVATGAAAKDVLLTCTSGSMTLTSGENVSDALNLTASGAASGMTLSAGTSGITLSSGIVNKITTVATAATPYAVLGTDSVITTNSGAGALTLTLPAAPATGRTIVVYDGAGQAAAGGNVTISGNGKNIAAAGSSAATKLLTTAYSSMTLYYNGTIWIGQKIT